jgi:hypothetical protein
MTYHLEGENISPCQAVSHVRTRQRGCETPLLVSVLCAQLLMIFVKHGNITLVWATRKGNTLCPARLYMGVVYRDLQEELPLSGSGMAEERTGMYIKPPMRETVNLSIQEPFST